VKTNDPAPLLKREKGKSSAEQGRGAKSLQGRKKEEFQSQELGEEPRICALGTGLKEQFLPLCLLWEGKEFPSWLLGTG